MAATNGLTIPEVESFLGRTMTSEELTIYHQSKALNKLEKAKEKKSIIKKPKTKKLDVVQVGPKNP